jgi:hypothetical protein
MMNYRILFLLSLIFSGAFTLIAADGPASDIHRLYFRLELKKLTPAEVTVPNGKSDIIVVNSVVNGSLSIRLGKAKPGANMADASADLVNEKTVDRALSSRHFVNLTPGRVLLTLGDNPNWTAVINVATQP